MISGKVRHNAVRYRSFALTGGLNEQVSNLETRPGELVRCVNYIEADDIYHGYESATGYERYDGTPLASSVAADFISEENYDDAAREARRDAILPVPGTGDVYGVHLYNDTLYAFRNHTTGHIHKATSSGWVTLPENSLADNGHIKAVNYRFSEFASNNEVMIFVDGVSYCHIYDGSVFTEVIPAGTTGKYPIDVVAWENRLVLVYEGGHLIFSEVGDPTAYDSSTGYAGEIFIGESVTGLKEAPGGILMIFTRSKIKFLYYGSTSSEFIFKLEDYSNSAGALKNTIKNILGDIYFADDRGFSAAIADPNTSAYSLRNVGKKVYKTYTAKRGSIVFGTVDRDKNRYYLFYNDDSNVSKAIVYTFVSKRMKGAGLIEYKHKFVSITESTDSQGYNHIYAGSADGYVYKLLSGTSFDGEVIPTRLLTSYYHYGFPRQWKRFKRVSLEIDADIQTTFRYRSQFEYGSPALPTAKQRIEIQGGAANGWGTGIWGQFIWQSATGQISKIELPINGYATNFGIELVTSSKYKKPHTIYNVITDFTLGSLKQ